MSDKPLKFLIFITKPYSFAVLEPIGDYLSRKTAHEFRWFTAGAADGYPISQPQMTKSDEVREYDPDAVLVPGNVVPDFWPGLKVQVFHGLGEEKKGHYRVTGFFDLYCTPGPYVTQKFEHKGKKSGRFLVRETGWPKLDLLNPDMDQKERKRSLGLDPERVLILYAPTFSPKLTSATDLLPEISDTQPSSYQWLIKFHSLMNPSLIKRYKLLSDKYSNVQVIEDLSIIPLLEAADVLVTDTSSVAYEYLCLDRPIVTYRARTRLDKGINITTAADLSGAIERSLMDPGEFSAQRREYLEQLHPYTDRQSASRVVRAVEDILASGEYRSLKKKSPDWVRQRQIRRIVHP